MDEEDLFLLGGFSERQVPGRDRHVDVGKEERSWGEECLAGCIVADADITLNPAGGRSQGPGS